MNLMPNPSIAVALSNEEAESRFATELETNALPASGRIHAIPVSDAPPKAGGLAEAAYCGFEIAASLIGLMVGLPIMLIIAVIIRLDSPGPVLFFMRRPARFALAPGREIVGRADLVPPPGGYDPDALYYVPKYFTLVKFRTMY